MVNKQLASRIAAALVATTMVGASAFAESRPSNETRARREAGGRISRDRGTPAQSRVEVRGERDRSRGGAGRVERDRPRGDRPSVDRNRTYDRDRNRDRSYDRNRDSSRYSDRSWRNDSRSRGAYRDSSRYSRGYSSRYQNRDRYYHNGRIHRVYPYGAGYRVWLTGCQYPFYIPAAYYHRNRFRVGVYIGLGGYYNSRGYYDYYDDDYRPGYYDRSTSRGAMRGVVESVDYRRETFVVRNEATGSFVTIIMRDRGRDPVRAGDTVELRGDWTRDGVFEAYAVDIIDYDSDR